MSIKVIKNILRKIRFPYIRSAVQKFQEANLMGDLCNKDGASRLAAKIEDFWRKRGFDVSVETREEGFVSTMRSARTDLRSDMINGMPVRASEVAAS